MFFEKEHLLFLLYAFSVIAITIFLIVLMAYKNGIYFFGIIGILFLVFSLIFVNKLDKIASKTILYSSLVVYPICFLILKINEHIFQVQGFDPLMLQYLDGYSFKFDLNYYKLTTIIIMFLSVCISLDIGISYIVSLEEVDRDLQTNKLSLLKQLEKNISEKILGININTLIFSFVAGNISYLIFLNDFKYNISSILNSKIICFEITQITFSLISSIAFISISKKIFEKIYIKNLKGEGFDSS
nr:YibE/F family protein [Oenococcus oeni]